MENVNSTQENVPVGTKVYWFPRSERFENTVPRVGIVTDTHPHGIVDLAVIPYQGGAIEEALHVYHSSDRRIKDHMGNISNAGRNRGFWDYIEQEASGCTCQCKCDELKKELSTLKGEVTKLKKADK